MAAAHGKDDALDYLIGEKLDNYVAPRFQDIWKDQCEAAEGIAARVRTLAASRPLGHPAGLVA
jgi:hypothetical protein